MFAILSLRSLFAFVADVMVQLPYLEKAVSLVLGFIGIKLIFEYFGGYFPTDFSLAIVAVILGGGVATSLMFPNPLLEQGEPGAEEDKKKKKKNN